MNGKITIVGNLAEDVSIKKKKTAPETEFGLLKIATNRGKNEVTYYTAFVYGLSKERAKLLTKGSLVYIYGDYRDELTCNSQLSEELKTKLEQTQTKEEVLKMACSLVTIDRIITVKDIDILYHKEAAK